MLIELGLYLSVGVFAGLIAGLLGAGGGAVIVPPLAWLFKLRGVADAVIMHLAIGTALATIVITSIASIRAHHRHSAVRWPLFARLSPGIVLGAWLGALLADALPSETLQQVFGVFMLLLSVQIACGFRPSPHRALPNAPGMFAFGILNGALSAVVGIGGAALTVPFLVWCNVPVRSAVATSAACGLPIALAGASGYVFAGWDATELPVWSSGYVYLPAFLGIAVTSTVFASLGAKLAHRLPTGVLKKIFAVVLALIGSQMLLG